MAGDAVAVSVIVPVLNGARTIGSLLTALAGQRPSELGAHEIIVVDNASDDDTRAIVQAAASPPLTLLHERVRGASAARNRGLAHASGGVLALIDADCVPSRGWLRELTAPFAHPSVIFAAGSLASYPPRTGAQRFAARYGLNDALRCLHMPVMPFANGRNLAVRRSAAITVGGWPVELYPGEDIEFSHRIRRTFGDAIVYCERALAFHQDRETDEELRRQALGYGRGIAMLYALHPDLLPWSRRMRARQVRTGLARRAQAAIATASARAGRTSAADAEFAGYLARWDRWFWQGFHEQRGAGQVAFPATEATAT